MYYSKQIAPFALSMMLMLGSALPAFAQNSPDTDDNTSSPASSTAPIAAPADGQHGDHHKWHHHHDDCQIMTKLNLTADQQKQLDDMKTSHMAANKSNWETMKANHQKLKALMQSGQGDSTEAKSLKRQLKESHMAMHKEHMETMKTVLTPDQYAQFTSLKEQCKAQHPHHHHDHSGATNSNGAS